MKHILASITLVAASAASAQSVAYDSVRLADALIESNWSSVEQALPLILAGLESQLKANGVTERASKVFGEELRQSMNRENFSRVFAVAVSAKFTPEEIRELTVFLQSKIGQKYASLTRDLAANPAYIAPIAKQACDGAVRRLDPGADRMSMSNICSRF